MNKKDNINMMEKYDGPKWTIFKDTSTGLAKCGGSINCKGAVMVSTKYGDMSLITAEYLQKLLRKRRIAARMIAERIRNENKAWSEYREVYSDLVDLKDALKYMIDLNEKNHEYLKKLQKEIEELQEENELINLENAHLNGKIAAYEKILKIEK